MLHAERHTYLMKSLCGEIPQKVLNRTIHRALQWKTKYRDIPVEKPETSEIMAINNAQNIDLTRAKYGFGRWALPKLKKELHHPDTYIVMRALVSILELVKDPEKTFEALRLGYVERMIDLLLHPREFIREHVCMIYYVLADQVAGSRAITRRYKALTNFARLLEDKLPCIQHKAQMVIDMISRRLCGAFGLNCPDFLVLLLRLIGGSPPTDDESVLLLHIMTLRGLLENKVRVLALEHSAMDIIIQMLRHSNEEIGMQAMECLSMLCWEPLGRAQADEKAVLFKIKKKLNDEKINVQAKAAGATAFLTITSAGKHFAYSLGLIDRLMELAANFHSNELQLNAVKALTNLSEEGLGRSLMVSGAIQRKIEGFVPASTDAERHIAILLSVIRWKP